LQSLNFVSENIIFCRCYFFSFVWLFEPKNSSITPNQVFHFILLAFTRSVKCLNYEQTSLSSAFYEDMVLPRSFLLALVPSR